MELDKDGLKLEHNFRKRTKWDEPTGQIGMEPDNGMERIGMEPDE